MRAPICPSRYARRDGSRGDRPRSADALARGLLAASTALIAGALLAACSCERPIARARDGGPVDARVADLDAEIGLDARAELDAEPGTDARVVDLDAPVAGDAGTIADAGVDAFVSAIDGGGGCIPPSVGLYAADDMGNHVRVRDFLVATGRVGTVTIGGPVTETDVPPLSELMTHDALFVWGSGSWDGTAFGNLLADYVDAGGGVVIAVFAQRAAPIVGVAGRMASAGYLPYVPADHGVDNLTLGPVSVPSHRIMRDVDAIGGTAFQFHNGSAAPGAMLIAQMSNGRPLVATLEPSMGRTSLLGFYPPILWDTATDGALLMANSVLWVSGCD